MGVVKDFVIVIEDKADLKNHIKLDSNNLISMETKDKAEELQHRINLLNQTSKIKYCGGIVIFANGQWYINDCAEYNYSGSDLSSLGWKTLAWKSL